MNIKNRFTGMSMPQYIIASYIITGVIMAAAIALKKWINTLRLETT